MPVWVLYLFDSGISLLQIGILGTVLELFRLLFEVPCGSFSDRFGEKSSVALSCVCGAACWSLFWLFPVQFPLLVLSMVLLALSGALSSGSFESWVSKLNSADHFPHVLARSNQATYALFVLGSVSSGHLYEVGPEWPFGALTLLLLVSLLPIALLPSPASARSGEPGIKSYSLGGAVREGLRLLRCSKMFWIVAGATFFANMSYDTVERYWQPFVGSRGAPAEIMGYVLAIGGIVALAALEIAKRLPEARGMAALAAMEIASVLLLLLVVFGSGYGVLVAIVLLLAIGRSRATFEQIVLNRSLPNEYKATLFSVISGAGALGEVLAGVGMGLVVQYLSLETGFAVSAALVFCSVLLFAHYLRYGGTSQSRLGNCQS